MGFRLAALLSVISRLQTTLNVVGTFEASIRSEGAAYRI